MKSYRRIRVVDDVWFTAEPGGVTGLLGPNGSGKTTVLRLMTGLARGGGSTLYDGVRFIDYQQPRNHVGVSIGTAPFNPARTGVAHLELIAAGAGLAAGRAHACLVDVGLDAAGRRRIKTYSLGMRQRLALAAAMLGDPEFVILDEPTNGLDPAAVLWFETWVRRLADQGRCVVVSTHQLHEAERFLDHAVVLVDGRVKAEGSITQLRASVTAPACVVAETDAARELLVALRDKGLAAHLDRRDPTPTRAGGRVVATGCEAGLVGEIATRAGISLRSLQTQHAPLEEVFAQLCARPQER